MADFEGVDTVCIDVCNLLIVLGPVVLSLIALIVVLVALVVLGGPRVELNVNA